MSDEDDTRVLNMRINNKQFLKGTSDSVKALDTLNKGIDGAGKGKGMQEMGKSVDTVKTKFGALQIAGVTAIANLSNRAVNAGLKLVKGLAIDPILDGYREYNKLLTSTQTIQANTGKSTQIVGKYLDELNHYSDQTIYNFGQMADNIGKFTAAGVKIGSATTAIKGLANTAALSGSTTEQLNTAMYQVSQALSTGTIKLMDWNSLVNAGMGGKNLQNALKATASSMDDLTRNKMTEAIKKGGSFRDSLQYGWLEADVFTKTMKVMAGTTDGAGKTVAYTVKQLQKMGYAKDAAKELHRLSQASIDSATEIKTFGQLIDVVKESIGSGWAGIFRSLFGNLEESKALWTNVGNIVTGAVNKIFTGVQNMLGVWREAGGFEKMWTSFGLIFKALGNVLAPIGALFNAIFPGTQKSGQALVGLTNGFYGFAVVLERVTRGVGFLTPVFTLLGKGIRFVIDTVKQLSGILAGPISDLLAKGREMGSNLIAGLVSSLNASGVIDAIQQMATSLIERFKNLLGIHSPSTVFAEFGRNIVEGLVNGVKGAVSLIGGAISAIGDQLASIDKYDVANIVSVVFGAGSFVVITKFIHALGQTMSTFKGFAAVFNAKILGKDGLIDQTTNTMKSMQTGIRAKAIMNIAIAIGILAASLWVLSKIPYDRLATGLVAIGIMMKGLQIMMTSMAKNAATTKTAIASMTAMAIAMGLMAGAILILSAAVLAFGLMPTGVLVKGLIAVGAALLILSAAAFVLGKAAPTMILAAAGVLILSIALGALAPVIMIYSKMDWSTILGGLAKMAVVLVGLGIAMIPLAAAAPLILIAAAALVVLSVGLTGMLAAIGLFASVSWGTIISGVAKISVALVAIGLAAAIASPGLILLGAAAILIGAGFLAAGVGMALFGAGLAVVAVAGTAAAAVLITAFEGFLAMLPLMATQLVSALAAFIGAIAHYAPSIVDSLVKIGSELLRGLVELGPKVAKAAVSLLMNFIDAVVDARLGIFNAAIDLIEGFLQTLRDRLPELIQVGTDLIVNVITGLGNASEQLVTAAGEAILSFLTALNTAITTYMPQITSLGLQIGQNLILGLIQGLVPDFIYTAFQNLVTNVLNFFRGLLGINSPSTVFAGFGRNIVEGLANGIGAVVGLVTGAIGNLVSSVVGIARGLPGRARDAISGLGGVLKSVFTGAFKTAVSIVGNGVSNIGSAIGRIPGILRGAVSAAGNAAKSIGEAIVKGIKNGLGAAVSAVGNLGGAVVQGIKNAVNSALNLPLKLPSIHINLPGPKDFDFGGGQTIIPHFAKGVTGFGGGAALVGEVGPELVTMGRGTNVITNENLQKFMKVVTNLTRLMTSGSSQNSPGGNIQYVVSADFRGDPKSSGTQFAANIAAGLINGLKGNQAGVNASIAGVATTMSDTFAGVLGIQSPSTVFRKYAGFVGQGFINGLLASVAGVAKAAKAMGDAATTAIAKTITDGQLKLESLRGKANAYSDAADELRAKAKRTKSKKARKRLEAEARALDKKAKSQDKTASKQAAAVDAANAKKERDEQYAAADTQGKADMKKEDAVSAAEAASRAREAAIRLSKEADLIRKRDKKRAKELDAEAKRQLERSKIFADRANAYAAESYKLAQEAKAEADKEAAEEAQRIQDQIQSVSAADVLKAQAQFEDYAKALADAQAAASKDAPPTEVNLTQNNYSPEAISAADAYRNGKSLVSIAERKLQPTP